MATILAHIQIKGDYIMNDLYIRAAKLYDDGYKEDDKARLIK